MEQFLSDLNQILSSNFHIRPNDTLGLSGLLSSIVVAMLAFFLAVRVAIKLASRKPRLKPAVIHTPEEPKKEVSIEVGEFGRIVSKTQVLVKGVELDYFIIKKSKYDKDTLPVGTIVVIIKRNANEAYVKPAEDKDKIRLKGLV